MAEILLDKNPTLADEAVKISVTGLAPLQKVSLHAWTEDENGAAFESLACYEAEVEGHICLSSSKSHGGTYEGVWAMGIISSIIPSSLNKKKYERFLIKDPMKPFSIRLCLYNDFIDMNTVHRLKNSNILAEKVVVRTYSVPHMVEEVVKVGRIRGILYYIETAPPRPGVISISGAYRGAMRHKASLLACRGFVGLALKYFGDDDLPEDHDELDLSYFEEAAVFLKNHPKVQGTNGVAIVSNCIGASIALYVASYAPAGLIRCVVAVSGWYMPYNNYVYKGKRMIVPIYSLREAERQQDGTYVIKTTASCFEDGTWRNNVEDFAKFHTKLSTAYMFVYGGQDPYVPQTQLLGVVGQTLLKEAGHRNYKFLYYSDAGHLIEHAFYPHTYTLWMDNVYQIQGGRRPAHNFAQDDSWPQVLNFIRDSFFPRSKL